MRTFQLPTTPSMDSEVIGNCFFTGRPVTRDTAAMIGPFQTGLQGSMTIFVHEETPGIDRLHEGWIRFANW